MCVYLNDCEHLERLAINPQLALDAIQKVAESCKAALAGNPLPKIAPEDTLAAMKIAYKAIMILKKEDRWTEL